MENQIDNKYEYIGQGITLVVIILYNAHLLRMHMKNKDHFPLKERSPVLTLILGISTTFSIVILIVG